MTRLVRRLLCVPALIALVLALPGLPRRRCCRISGGTPGTSSTFVLVGQHPFFNRGRHAALAIFDHSVSSEHPY